MRWFRQVETIRTLVTRIVTHLKWQPKSSRRGLRCSSVFETPLIVSFPTISKFPAVDEGAVMD